MAKKFFFKQFFVSRKTKILEPNFLQKLGVFLDPKNTIFYHFNFSITLQLISKKETNQTTIFKTIISLRIANASRKKTQKNFPQPNSVPLFKISRLSQLKWTKKDLKARLIFVENLVLVSWFSEIQKIAWKKIFLPRISFFKKKHWWTIMFQKKKISPILCEKKECFELKNSLKNKENFW